MIGDLYQSALRYGDTYEESSADGVRPRPHWEPLMESLHGLGTGGTGPALGAGGAAYPREWHHVQHLRRSAWGRTGHGAPMLFR